MWVSRLVSLAAQETKVLKWTKETLVESFALSPRLLPFQLLQFLFTYTKRAAPLEDISTRTHRQTFSLSRSLACLLHMRIVSQKVSCCVLLPSLIQRTTHKEKYEGHGMELHQVQKIQVAENLFLRSSSLLHKQQRRANSCSVGRYLIVRVKILFWIIAQFHNDGVSVVDQRGNIFKIFLNSFLILTKQWRRIPSESHRQFQLKTGD